MHRAQERETIVPRSEKGLRRMLTHKYMDKSAYIYIYCSVFVTAWFKR